MASLRLAKRKWVSVFMLAGVAILSFITAGTQMLGQKAAPDVSAVLGKCQQCHGATAQMSHFSVMGRDLMLKGGDHGPAIVPGNADDSLLYKRISGQVKPVMPMAPMPQLSPE